MPRFLFRNRWFALVWAVGVLASIGLFFSEGGGQEDLAQATETIRENAEFARNEPEAEPTFLDETEEEEAEEPAFAEEEPATGTRRVMTAKMRLGRPAAGEADTDGEDDGAETYVILDSGTAIPEDGDF